MKKYLFAFALTLAVSFNLSSQSSYKYGPDFKIKAPSHMKEMTGLNDEADIQYGNIYRGMYFIVISDDKSQMIDGLKEFGMYNNYESPLNNFSDFMLELYQDEEAMGYMKNIQKEKFFAGDSPSEIIFFESNIYDETTNSNIDIFYSITFIAGKNNFYQVLSWVGKEDKYKYKADLKAIAYSFEEL